MFRVFIARNPRRTPAEKQDDFVATAWRVTGWIIGILTLGGIADLLGLIS